MSPLMVLGLVKFILTSGHDIVEQCNLAVKFAQDLLSDYREQGETPGVNAAAMTCDDAKVERLAESHPMIAAACMNYGNVNSDQGDATVSVASAANARGVFGDLIRVILADPQKFIELFNLFRDIFGGASSVGETSTGPTAGTTAEPTAN